MVEVVKPAGNSYDEIAEEIFWKAIELAGGLSRLVEYRHLTWLPSLATASYAIAMKEEGMMDKRTIAEKLGVTPETVDSILRARAELEEILQGEERKEHKAGALARLAYEELKKEGFGIRIGGREVKELSEIVGESAWAIAVLKAIKGVRFPAPADDIRKRISGIPVRGKDAGELLSSHGIDEIRSPAELLRVLKDLSEKE